MEYNNVQWLDGWVLDGLKAILRIAYCQKIVTFLDWILGFIWDFCQNIGAGKALVFIIQSSKILSVQVILLDAQPICCAFCIEKEETLGRKTLPEGKKKLRVHITTNQKPWMSVNYLWTAK